MKLLSRKKSLLAAAVLSIAAGAWYWVASERVVVRPIEVAVGDGGPGLPIVGVSVFHTQEDLQAAYPQMTVRLSREVDFGREDLVRVGWQSAGVVSEGPKPGREPAKPQFGDLVWRARGGGRKLIFSVREPSPCGRAGSVFEEVLREDWFTVPKGRQVELADDQRVVLHDAAFLAMLLVASVFLCVLPLRSRATARSGAAQPATPA